MTTHNMNRTGANLRGALIIAAAVVAAALADRNITGALPAWAHSALGLVAVALLSWRAFVDQSLGDARSATALLPPAAIGLSAGKAVSEAADAAAAALAASASAKAAADAERQRIQSQIEELQRQLAAPL